MGRGPSRLVSQVAAFYIPSSKWVRMPTSPRNRCHLPLSVFLILAIPPGCEMVSHFGFDWHFPSRLMTVENLFLWSLAIYWRNGCCCPLPIFKWSLMSFRKCHPSFYRLYLISQGGDSSGPSLRRLRRRRVHRSFRRLPHTLGTLHYFSYVSTFGDCPWAFDPVQLTK